MDSKFEYLFAKLILKKQKTIDNVYPRLRENVSKLVDSMRPLEQDEAIEMRKNFPATEVNSDEA